MQTVLPPFDDLVRALHCRALLPPLIRALGLEPRLEEVPREVWGSYGIAPAPDLAAVVLAGGAGPLRGLLVELCDAATPRRPAAIANGVLRHNPSQLHLLVFAWPEYRRLVLGTFGLEDQFRHLVVERHRLVASDLEALEEMAPRDGEQGLDLALRHARALDRSRVTGRFFRDFRAQRDSVAGAWTGLPQEAERERLQLALLLLSRLTFLCFLQQRGALLGDDRYLVQLYGRFRGRTSGSVYRDALVPLFFGALNRRPEDRSEAARSLGALPYLNGGLFEPHLLERRHPDVDLPDEVVESVLLDLLERYRFTTREAGEGAGYGIDPEMLGRVFEGLMEEDQRGDTGSFYTPAPVVNRIVREGIAEYLAGACPEVEQGALVGAAAEGHPTGSTVAVPMGARHRVRRALERVRVLDPACGSGAFLLGALHHLSRLHELVSEDGESGEGREPGSVRRDIVARSLHGVDLLDDAALLCSLRLWLALSADHPVRPLPNLDRRIRQGDALVDPLDLGAVESGATPLVPAVDAMADPGLREAVRAVPPAARRYLASSPEDRESARAELATAERRLARRWIRRLRSIDDQQLRVLEAAAADRDLFGEQAPHARRAEQARVRVLDHRGEMEELARALDEDDAVPFFSFGVHFADVQDGFQLIVSNPPWIRSHRWPDRLRSLAQRSYEVCRSPGWSGATELTGNRAGAGSQVDLSLLFVERSIRLLAAGGVLAVVLPAKAMRALYGGAVRRILLRDLQLALIEDHALDQRSIFRADAFAAVLVGRRAEPRPEGRTRVSMVGRGVEPLRFEVRQRDLPLFPDDPESPWIMAPPEVVAALRTMQRSGQPLGRHEGLRVRRGIMTGANSELVLSRVEPKLGGLSRVEAEGYRSTRRAGGLARAAGQYRAWLETAAVRPLVRGAGIDAFGYRVDRWVVWCHDRDGEPLEPPERTRRYLGRHRQRLQARAGWRDGLPLGVVFRLSADSLGHKVAWHDLSDTLRAVALPARVELDGRLVELVPLNTVYFMPVPTAAEARVLAAVFNSLPARTFARAIAERAKDARFRFFAWTLSCLPLPSRWSGTAAGAELAAVSDSAHSRGGATAAEQARIDAAAAALWGLDADEMAAMRAFDRWLRGEA